MESNNQKNISIEALLSDAVFQPAMTYNSELHDRLLGRLKSINQEPLPQERTNGFHSRMNTRPVHPVGWRWRWVVASVLAVIFSLSALIGFVPAVQAQVVSLLKHFGVTLPFTNAGLVISPFTPLAPASVPEDINFFFSLNMDTGSSDYIELRYFNQNSFIVIYETPAGAGMTYPAGEEIKVGSFDGILSDQHEGMVLLGAPAPQPWRPSGSGGGGGGGGGLETPPPMLAYESAVQITWVQDGMWIELLTNLPAEDALELAGSLQPAPELRK